MAEIAFIKIQGQDDFNRLKRALRDAGRGDLQRQLTREVRRVGDPALRAAQSGFRGISVQSSAGGGGSSGLRASVANATAIRIVKGGISIQVYPRRMDNRHRPWGRSLSYGLDGLGRWRHPVFGNRNVWVEQTGQEVFYRSLKRFESRWRAGIEKAMDETARKLEG